MSIVMRIVQQYDIRQESKWWELEAQFAALERRRSDDPRGWRLKPISGPYPCTTLIWECEFPSLDAAQRALEFFAGDAEHEALLKEAAPLFEQVRIEFYEKRDL